MARVDLGRLSNLIRVVFAPEKLDELPAVQVDRSRTSILGMLTAGEELPKDIIAPAERGKPLSWLLQSEHLPFDPHVPASRRASFLGTLLSRERLPEDPVPVAGAGRPRGGRT
jgi:hypothetical protein